MGPAVVTNGSSSAMPSPPTNGTLRIPTSPIWRLAAARRRLDVVPPKNTMSGLKPWILVSSALKSCCPRVRCSCPKIRPPSSGEAPFEHAREARPTYVCACRRRRRTPSGNPACARVLAAAAPPWRSVGRTHAKERVHVGVRAAAGLRRFVALGQQRARRRGADLHDAGVVRHRDLRLGDVRVVGADHAQHRRVGDERLHVLHALRRIVNALHRVVEHVTGTSVNPPIASRALAFLGIAEDRTVLRGDADRRVAAPLTGRSMPMRIVPEVAAQAEQTPSRPRRHAKTNARSVRAR